MVRKQDKRRAFTLVELLVVIIILAMLAGFMIPNVFKYVGKAKKKLVVPKMAVVEDALVRFQADCERLPDDSEGLNVLIENTGEIAGWDGRYLKPSQLLDPWGNAFIYVSEGQVNPGSFDLISLGADGQEGGDKGTDNEDVYNEL